MTTSKITLSTAIAKAFTSIENANKKFKKAVTNAISESIKLDDDFNSVCEIFNLCLTSFTENMTPEQIKELEETNSSFKAFVKKLINQSTLLNKLVPVENKNWSISRVMSDIVINKNKVWSGQLQITLKEKAKKAPKSDSKADSKADGKADGKLTPTAIAELFAALNVTSQIEMLKAISPALKCTVLQAVDSVTCDVSIANKLDESIQKAKVNS